ncbi:MAG: hypothetical protein M3O50_20935 [Myxococcota bacterium]|nr:hypothetical protein [Myxococcota bacterium]
MSASTPAAPLASVMQGLSCGALLASVAFGTALLHALRVGLCDLWGGTALFVLTAGFGALMGGAWGAVVGEACRGRRSRRVGCVLLGLAAPLAGIVGSLARFYASPMVFQYDPFFGFFSGALYDTVVDVRPELWTYRAGSLATLTGAVLVASALKRTPDDRMVLYDGRSNGSASSRLALGLLALAASVVMVAKGPLLGHWQTADTIAAALGGRLAGARCDVVYPDSLRAAEAMLLVQDCDQELVSAETALGAHLDGRMTAYVFRDADEKRRLMGAAETSIAKPWRREIYVQLSGFPHPVLGHEIAHVLSGTFGRGPLRIAGAAGGLWPNPGLIEGIAVAASPDDDELTVAQWARAMLDLGILPRAERLFSLGFLGDNAAKSYTAAGAFVGWILHERGAEVVRAWYGGASLEAMTGRPWEGLDDAFREALRHLEMPPEASSYARAKFSRPSVWARQCPHAVDALNRDGDRCRDEHRVARAVSFYDRALAHDPRDWHARFERARLGMVAGDDPAQRVRARSDLARMEEDEGAPRTWRDRALEALADDEWARGDADHVASVYRALAARTLDEDSGRTLEVKALAVGDPSGRPAILDLLLGRPGHPVDAWLGAMSLGVWAEERHAALPAYLAGKNLATRNEHARAAAWLDEALETGAPTARIGRELLRQRAICACALGDRLSLGRVRDRVVAPGSPFDEARGEGRRDWLLRFVARCGGG